jgi:hypothetical protein
LPAAGGAGATVIDVDSAEDRGSPARTPALAARTVSSVPALVGARSLAAPWTEEERARVEERVLKLTDSAHTEVNASFRKLLDVWTSEVEHKSWLKRVQLGGDLAYAGQMYRAVLDAMPLDPFAKKAQAEILTLAMATMTSAKDLGTPERGQAGKVALLLLGAVFLAVILLVGAKLLKSLSGDVRIDDGTGVLPAP